MAYTFRQTIWAVGQGGFSMGSLYDDKKNRLYTYVYDCGSDQLADLKRERTSAKSHADKMSDLRIDTFFISHLDADHINGFDALIEAVDRRIDEIILPYLDLVDRYYLAAKAMSTGTATGLSLDFYSDPVKWIRRRLPDATIRLLGGAPPMDPPLFPDGPHPIGDSTGSVHGTSLGVGSKTSYKGLSQHTWIAKHPSHSKSTKSSYPILLLAHLPPRSQKKLDAFARELAANKFKLTPSALREILSDAAKRVKLRECYEELASDHNIVSIHLLAQVSSSFESSLVEAKEHFRHRCFDNHFAFLFSGDAKLSTNKYLKSWRAFYAPYLNNIRVFSLPHHGSILNFGAGLVDEMPAALFIAQAGKNSHGHPATEEINAYLSGSSRRHSEIYQVSGASQTRIDVRYSLLPCT